MLEKDEKEFRKKFKFEGPILVLHSMMVDLNASIKKTGGTALAVVQGEILEVIQVTSDKKALCRNKQGKCMEGDDVYDDVDHITGMLFFIFFYILLWFLERVLRRKNYCKSS
uniref:Helically-extended SH3 domain-containing protein n=1 Tax=Oncorhynchus mykiss TaxID=8022 RepID=A0A8L0DJH3_ONCMY